MTETPNLAVEPEPEVLTEVLLREKGSHGQDIIIKLEAEVVFQIYLNRIIDGHVIAEPDATKTRRSGTVKKIELRGKLKSPFLIIETKEDGLQAYDVIMKIRLFESY